MSTQLPRYIVRDDVMYIPEWEWNSSETSILGLPVLTTMTYPYDGKYGQGHWLVIAFPNGWAIAALLNHFSSLYFSYQIMIIPIFVWEWHKPHEDWESDERIVVPTLDRLLGCIRTIADRPDIVRDGDE